MQLDLYACATPSHQELVDLHFLPSIPASLNLVELRTLPQPSVEGRASSGAFDDAGFHAACVSKVEYIIDVIRRRREAGRQLPFVFSDVDVRFYGEGHAQSLVRELGACDIVFQNDGPGGACTGFMVMRATNTIAALFNRVRAIMVEKGIFDQDAMRVVLGEHRARWDGLNTGKYWTYGLEALGRWEPGKVVRPPIELRMHHANWTNGLVNKLALLEQVRICMEERAAVEAAKVHPARSYRPAQVEDLCKGLVGEDDEMEDLREHLSPNTAVAKDPRDQGAGVLYEDTSTGLQGRAPMAPVTVKSVQTRWMTDEEKAALQGRTYTVPQIQQLLEHQRAQLTSVHHPMPLALVLQYWEGDAGKAMDLARLLADIEPVRRDDVLLVFAEQQGTRAAMGASYDVVTAAKAYLVEKFNACEIVVPCDRAKKYPGIAYDPWFGALSWMWDRFAAGDLPHHSAFFFEWDGCPMTKTWINDLKRAHAETLAAGKMVTGARMKEPLHVNGTAVMLTRACVDIPSLSSCPPRAAWDIHHGHALVRELGPATPIGNHWGMGSMSEDVWRSLAHTYCWLTSTKDGCAQHWARRNLVSRARR